MSLLFIIKKKGLADPRHSQNPVGILPDFFELVNIVLSIQSERTIYAI